MRFPLQTSSVTAVLWVLAIVGGVVASSGCTPVESSRKTAAADDSQGDGSKSEQLGAANAQGPIEVATLAGGCFWCVEASFEKVPGVITAVSGYTGGHLPDPTYEQVGTKTTGHTEAIQVSYDSAVLSYDDVLQVFWRQADPTDLGGQFVDRGSPYRPAIFYHNEAQRLAAEASKQALQQSGRFPKPVVIPIEKLDVFYVAEEYHQDFYKKDPQRYNSYRKGSGRDSLLDKIWGKERKYEVARAGFKKPTKKELRKSLTPLQYQVTQEDSTERPFDNEFWDSKKRGIYVDIVSGEALFSSLDKFDSGTGWPSFTRPLVADHIHENTDHKLGYPRTEVRSKNADSHLGHVFADGPPPTGQRYCINSAALRFVPADRLVAEGYGQFQDLFKANTLGGAGKSPSSRPASQPR